MIKYTSSVGLKISLPMRKGSKPVERISLHMRKGDLIAIALLCAAALCAACVLPLLRGSDSVSARILLDGEVVREVPLSVDQTFQIRGAYTNTITVRDGKIAVTHSDCPNHDCVRMGWLQDGGAIVCLPNRMEIRLTGSTDVDVVIP